MSKKEGGLGFRDVHAFNLATLMQTPDSLCARILKVKCFPNSSCLSARPKDGISYTWRSILKGILVLIKEGMIWRIGDGGRDRYLE